MTDKQIINGVDVSGCSWYTQGATGMICADWHLSNDCSKNSNCYYKQLKAKEQECERLEKQNEILLGQLVINDGEDVTVQISQSQFEEYNQLKVENRELKAVHSCNVALSDELFKYKAENDSLKSELMQTNCYLDADKEIIDKLKAETEELKKQVNDLLHKPEIQNKILWKIDNEALLGSKDAWIYKLEKTLTEIKEIVEDESYIGFWDEQISEILQKISKCEVTND